MIPATALAMAANWRRPGREMLNPSGVVYIGRESVSEATAMRRFSASQTNIPAKTMVNSVPWLRSIVARTYWYPSSSNHNQSV
jgi:hypothetical protein